MVLIEIDKICPECGGALIDDSEAGERVCTHCGLVVSLLSPTLEPEWRTFPDKKKRDRVGSPLSFGFHDMGLSTSIGQGMKDHSGRKIDPEMKASIERMRVQQRRSTNSWSRNLRYANPKIIDLCQKMGLPRSVSYSSARLYRTLVKSGGLKGRDISEMVPAIVYLGCRICGVIRLLTDFVDVTGLSKKTIGKNYRVALKFLKIKPPKYNLLNRVSQVVTKLNVNRVTEKLAFKIARAFMPTITCKGKSPQVITASIVYAASLLSGEKMIQEAVAEAASTTEVSLRNRLRDIEKVLMFEVKL